MASPRRRGGAWRIAAPRDGSGPRADCRSRSGRSSRRTRRVRRGKRGGLSGRKAPAKASFAAAALKRTGSVASHHSCRHDRRRASWRAFNGRRTGSAPATPAAKTPGRQHVRDEVQAPPLVRPLWQRHGRPCAQRPLAAVALLHREPLLATEPEQLLVVQIDTFPSQQDMQRPIVEPPPFRRQFFQPRPQGGIVRPP